MRANIHGMTLLSSLALASACIDRRPGHEDRRQKTPHAPVSGETATVSDAPPDESDGQSGDENEGEHRPTAPSTQEPASAPPSPVATSDDGSLTIAAVYLAQTHVLPPDHALSRLVSDREALLKVDVTAREPNQAAPAIKVLAKLDSKQETFALTGPDTLPTAKGSSLHAFSDSYTVTIPKAWIRPGLALELTAGSLRQQITPKVGAANPLHLTLLQWNIFKAPPSPDEPDWRAELEAKLPISRLTVERLEPWLLSEVVVPPRGDVGLPAVRVRSTDDYKQKTGQNFDGEQGLTLALTNAIQVAAGHNRTSIYFAYVAGVGVGGGLADSFTAMGAAAHLGVLLHELGHTMSLPHWANNTKYPYQGDLDGVKGDPGHVGKTWGYDPRVGTASGSIALPYFIPPTVQPTTVGREQGVFKKDPMAGGGTGDQEKGFHFRMFSDFSVHQMQSFLEKELVIWDEERQSFTRWDDAALTYASVVANGVDLPLERDVSVYTIIYSTSAVTTEANFVYAPLGPRRSSLPRLFDASRNEDRVAARADYCRPRCDFTLAVTQGGRTARYVARGTWKPDADPLQSESHVVAALNLPSAGGAITEVELLLTPDVAVAGLPASPRTLDRYVAP